MPDFEHMPLTPELLGVMRRAARTSIELNEPFITARSILLALLDEPGLGSGLATVVNRQKVRDAAAGESSDASSELNQPTLAFKTPDGSTSMWLGKDAYRIFIEGLQRADDRYKPKHLAFGLAAQAIHAPSVLAAIRVEPGALADAIYKL